MTDRDELEALIDAAMDDFDEFYGPGTLRTGERILTEILARWRLVPVEPTGPCGAVNPDTGDVCALTTGHARHHLSAEQRDETRQRRDQHRAAGELTRHDQTAGIYDLDRERNSDSPLYRD
jgi:hypothetical protein